MRIFPDRVLGQDRQAILRIDCAHESPKFPASRQFLPRGTTDSSRRRLLPISNSSRCSFIAPGVDRFTAVIDCMPDRQLWPDFPEVGAGEVGDRNHQAPISAKSDHGCWGNKALGADPFLLRSFPQRFLYRLPFGIASHTVLDSASVCGLLRDEQKLFVGRLNKRQTGSSGSLLKSKPT